MIDGLSLIAVKIKWAKPLINTILLISLCIFVFIIFGSTSFAADDTYLIPSLMALIWSLLACSFLYTFPYVPCKSTKNDSFINRFKIKLLRGYYYLLAVISGLASFTVLLLSFRMITIWLRTYI